MVESPITTRIVLLKPCRKSENVIQVQSTRKLKAWNPQNPCMWFEALLRCLLVRHCTAMARNELTSPGKN
eukprot:1828893-Amphidinium_carterae.1